jgi:hypothetical protein
MSALLPSLRAGTGTIRAYKKPGSGDRSVELVIQLARSSSALILGGANSSRDRVVFYCISNILAAFAFLGPGVGNLVRVPHIAQDMAHLGYPSYFMTILGIWKVLGAGVILAPRMPRLKEWAYAGMIFDLTGAAASRAVMRDGPPTVIVPLAIAGLVVASWALRPSGRVVGHAPTTEQK